MVRVKPETKPGRGAAETSLREQLASHLAAAGSAPEQARLFPPTSGEAAEALHGALVSLLHRYRDEVGENAFQNPTFALAIDLIRRLDDGTLGHGDIETLIQRLSALSFVRRAERLRRYLGERDLARNDERLARLFRTLAEEGRAPFAQFRERLEAELFGIVITAHPTFSLFGDLIRTLSSLAVDETLEGGPLSDEARERLLAKAMAAEHRPDKPLDLMVEHNLSLEAIGNIQWALRRVYEVAFDTVRELYPDDWHRLMPRLLTVASWVGYDLDGRSDITWTVTLHTRLKVQIVQLERYLELVQQIRAEAASIGGNDQADMTLELIESRLALAIKEIREEVEVFGTADGAEVSDYERIRRIAKRMQEGLSLRLVESGHLIHLVGRCIESTRDPGLVRRLCLLRAELANYGLAMAHTHVRLNASQLHNAIRSEIRLTAAPDDPRFRRSFIQAINELLETVQPVTINFGTILAERASARRLFMVVTQMLKYVDATAPVRFLIAESDTTLTVLVALYFAKLFGIEDRIDISPLFETEKALERAVRIVRDLLANPHYRAYVKRRRRLCIQTGFSDAGRLLGQTTAAAGMERLKLGLTELLAKEGLQDVQLLVFDTHGEAIGRGGHPGSFEERLDYIMTPESRARAEARGIALKQEVSFQGGDGYVYFMTPAIAYAAVCRILERTLAAPVAEPDAFYEEWDYVVEFFATVNQVNRNVMADPNYAALLSMYGTNLLYPAGSRSLTRQSDDPLDTGVEVTDPMQLRAISHNSILQQMGYLANTLGGVGLAIAKDPDGFANLYARSPRMRLIVSMALWARAFSDINTLKAYIDITDPGRWLARAAQIGDPEQAADVIKVAEYLESFNLHVPLNAVYRLFQRDDMELERGLATLDAALGEHVEKPLVDDAVKDDLALLHALRLALIRELFVLAARIPEFSPQYGTTPQIMRRRIVHLQVERAVELLGQIFPPYQNVALVDDFGEPATYRSQTIHGYEAQHREIFEPMARLHTLIRRISTAVIHLIGATG